MKQPTEIAKWAWHVNNTDVIVRDPKTGVTGAWPVTSVTKCVDGCTVVTCDLEDGGERVLVYQPTQRVDVRAHAVYSAPALLTPEQRVDVLSSANERERVFLLAQFIHRYGELFDAEYARLQTARAAGADVLREVTA